MEIYVVRQKFYLIFYTQGVYHVHLRLFTLKGTYKSAKFFFVHIHHSDYYKEYQLENIAKHPKNLFNEENSSMQLVIL